MIRLNAAELDRSLRLVESEGLSDLLPRPFEIDAVRSGWSTMRPILEAIDLSRYSPRPSVVVTAPKHRYTVRPAHLLDPIDCLLLNGLLLRVAPAIERARVGPERVFGTRFDGSVPDRFGDWQAEYVRFKSAVQQRLGERPVCATADIVDFYPRVYLHRLENSLTAAGLAADEVSIVLRFLKTWSGGTSYGIPVGPSFSGLLGEMLLDETDRYLLSRNIDFLRFIDDYVLFSDSEEGCLAGLFALGERLQQTQGLSLNMLKTAVWPTWQYKLRLDSPERRADPLRREVINKVFGGNPYARVDYRALTAEQWRLINRLDIARLIKEELESTARTNLEGIRLLLSVLTIVRRPELSELVIGNLSALYAASPGVAQYLSSFDELDSAARLRVGSEVLSFLDRPTTPEFQAIWLLEPFVVSTKWNYADKLRIIAANHSSPLVRRQAALAVAQVGDRSALLDLKAKVDRTEGWERRAVIYACRQLPRDERDAFLRQVQPRSVVAENCLEAAVCDLARNRNPLPGAAA